jgi:dTDP-4-amino-4,6-dideoxygalactose transaminase
MHAVRHAWLGSSGTIAVELALRGLKVAAGDEVILAAYDFPGNFRAIEAIGARPMLVDLAPGTWTLDVDHVEAAISPVTKAIVVSHLHGSLADMQRLCELANERGLTIVEDACQVPGASISGRPTGSWGDCGILSFGGSKLLTAGRGGAITRCAPPGGWTKQSRHMRWPFEFIRAMRWGTGISEWPSERRGEWRTQSRNSVKPFN